jgi:hypothetical protein
MQRQSALEAHILSRDKSTIQNDPAGGKKTLLLSRREIARATQD